MYLSDSVKYGEVEIMPTTNEKKLAGWLSVTEITGSWVEPGLIDWKVKVGAKEARRISTLATKLGTRVHELCQEFSTKGKVKLKSSDGLEVANCLKGWEEFISQYQPVISTMEKEVKDEENKLVGHVDLIATIRGVPYVLDIKTSSKVRPSYWLQVHAYSYMEGNKFDVGIVQLNKDLGTSRVELMKYNEEVTEVFKSLVRVHKYFNMANGQEREGTNGSNSPADNTFRDRPKVALPEVRNLGGIGDR